MDLLHIGPGAHWLPQHPPAPSEPCRIVLTFATPGRALMNVRCRCQAGTSRPAAERFYGYDPLGQAATIEGAMALWEAHRDEQPGEAQAARPVGEDVAGRTAGPAA